MILYIPYFFPQYFYLFRPYVKFLIHFELILVQGERFRSISIFYRWIFSFPSTIYRKGIFSPKNVLGPIFENQMAVNAFTFSLVFMSAFVSVNAAFSAMAI
jgi:hypothetical protein